MYIYRCVYQRPAVTHVSNDDYWRVNRARLTPFICAIHATAARCYTCLAVPSRVANNDNRHNNTRKNSRSGYLHLASAYQHQFTVDEELGPLLHLDIVCSFGCC